MNTLINNGNLCAMPEKQNRTVEGLQTRAAFEPKSLNDSDRTVDVVFATEMPVRTFTWEDGIVNEVLTFSPENVRLSRINSGAPILDNHRSWEGTKGVLGTVENARIENGKGVATLRFSKRASMDETWQDVKDGILQGVSVGYTVYSYEITRTDGSLPTYKAIDWEPFEISLAPIPSDIDSRVRSKENLENKPQKTEKMPDTTTAEIATEQTEATRKADEQKAKEIQEAAISSERSRVKEINDAVRAAKLGSDFAEKLIADGTSISKARKLVIDELAKTDAGTVSTNKISIGKDEKEKIRKGMEDALEHRANPSIKLTDEGREFRGLNLIDFSRRCAEDAGINTRGMSAREVAIAGLGLSERAYMSSSDFPSILGNTVNRTLRRAYELYEPTFMPFTQRGVAKDFRQMTRVQLGDVTKMKKIVEGGEYKNGNMGESKESYGVDKYGLIIPITWEMIINDDLSAFSRIPSSIANKARQLQSDVVYSILSANANMNDGNALFSTAHKNYTSSGTAISVASLQVGRQMIRTQKDVGGVDQLNLVPKFLVVGPAQEQLAYQYTSTNYVPTKNSDINPVYNTALSVIVDPRLTGNEWYLIADPAQIDTIEYSFLEGDGELFTEQRRGFEVDGLEIKARMVFGAKAIDYRGMYKNAGA